MKGVDLVGVGRRREGEHRASCRQSRFLVERPRTRRISGRRDRSGDRRSEVMLHGWREPASGISCVIKRTDSHGFSTGSIRRVGCRRSSPFHDPSRCCRALLGPLPGAGKGPLANDSRSATIREVVKRMRRAAGQIAVPRTWTSTTRTCSGRRGESGGDQMSRRLVDLVTARIPPWRSRFVEHFRSGRRTQQQTIRPALYRVWGQSRISSVMIGRRPRGGW